MRNTDEIGKAKKAKRWILLSGILSTIPYDTLTRWDLINEFHFIINNRGHMITVSMLTPI